MKKKPFWKYLIFFVVLFGLFLAVVFGFGFVKFTQIQGFIKLAKSGAFEPPPTAVTTDVAKAIGMATDARERWDCHGSERRDGEHGSGRYCAPDRIRVRK